MPFMSAASCHHRRASTASSPAPAIPARMAGRFPSTAPTSNAWRGACWPRRRSRRSVSAPASRCGSKPGSASTATTSTRRPRRSRPRSPGPSASAAAARAAFPAARSSCSQLAEGAAPPRRHPARGQGAGARTHRDPASATSPIGEITSGGFGPTVGGPIAMGYVAAGHAAPGTAVELLVRGTPRPARIADMPFTPHRYYRG